MSIYKNYKLVTLDQRFIAETIARTGSEQLLDKLTRSYVGLYNSDESWYLPLRANIGKNKPLGAYFATPFPTDNPHFKRPGIDFEKALFVPDEFIIPIRNTLPNEQAKLINERSKSISDDFENYVLNLENIPKKSPSYRFSTVPLFPEGIEKIKEITVGEKDNLQMLGNENKKEDSTMAQKDNINKLLHKAINYLKFNEELSEDERKRVEENGTPINHRTNQEINLLAQNGKFLDLYKNLDEEISNFNTENNTNITRDDFVKALDDYSNSHPFKPDIDTLYSISQKGGLLSFNDSFTSIYGSESALEGYMEYKIDDVARSIFEELEDWGITEKMFHQLGIESIKDYQNAMISYREKNRQELLSQSNDVNQLKNMANQLNIKVTDKDTERFSNLTPNQRQAVLDELTLQKQKNSEHPAHKKETREPDIEL